MQYFPKLSVLAVSFMMAGLAAAQTTTMDFKLPEDPEKPARDTGEPKQQQLGPAKTPEKVYTDRLALTPDISQHIRWSQFLAKMDGHPSQAKYTPPDEYNQNWKVLPGNFCGPAAVANHMLWLDKTVYPKLTDEPHDYAAALMLADELGRKYMDTMTDPEMDEDGWVDIPEGTGTKAKEFVQGTLDYLSDHGVKVKAIRISSAIDHGLDGKIRTYGAPIYFDEEKPGPDLINDALLRRSIVVTLHGYYAPTNPKPFESTSFGRATMKSADMAKDDITWSAPRLERVGGHYAAPVGFKHSETLYHDSADAQSLTPQQTTYKWREVTAAQFPENPILVNYMTGSTLKKEHLRCDFAPQAFKDNGTNWSLECRGTLRGHYASYAAKGSTTHFPGMPPAKSKLGQNADRVKILETLFEFEIAEPGPIGRNRG